MGACPFGCWILGGFWSIWDVFCLFLVDISWFCGLWWNLVDLDVFCGFPIFMFLCVCNRFLLEIYVSSVLQSNVDGNCISYVFAMAYCGNLIFLMFSAMDFSWKL